MAGHGIVSIGLSSPGRFHFLETTRGRAGDLNAVILALVFADQGGQAAGVVVIDDDLQSPAVRDLTGCAGEVEFRLLPAFTLAVFLQRSQKNTRDEIVFLHYSSA